MKLRRPLLPSLAACAALGLASAQDEPHLYQLLADERARLTALVDDPATAPDVAGAARAKRDRLHEVLYSPEEHRIQILVAEVIQSEGQAPSVRSTNWRSREEYFYPASAIKLCAAVAALERLNEIQRTKEPAATDTTPLAFYSVRDPKELFTQDATNLDGGTLTLAHLIRRACLVSDNEAYNLLYEFCGQQWLNERMWRAGCKTVRLRHRLSVDMPLQKNKVTPSIELRFPERTVMLGAQQSALDLDAQDFTSMYVGKAYMDGKERIKGSFSFTQKNVISLPDLQKCLMRVVRPDLKLDGEPFDLSDAQRAFLMEVLAQYPGDSRNPAYPRAEYPDEWGKLFLPGLERVVPKEHLKVHNKFGLAYGFAVDNAYVVDTRSQRSFFLAATVWADSDGTLNDDKYDYDTFSRPLLADVAELAARDLWQPGTK
jgi:hypothetical protein